MNASSWVIILLLTCSPFIAFGLASFTIFCCDCNQDGDIVILKSGWRVRKRLIEDSLVTKKIKKHSEMPWRMCSNSANATPRRVPTSGDSSTTTITTKVGHESEYSHSRCIICLEQYQENDSVSWARNTMYCNHAFHTSCIKKWLKKKRSCPCCRYGIIRWEDMYVRCNAWNDTCFGRRSRVLSDQRHRVLLSKCRETGQYCMEHGLCFPFTAPILEEPYEPRIQEMEDRLAIASGRESQVQYQHQDVEGQVRLMSRQTVADPRFPLRIPTNTIDGT